MLDSEEDADTDDVDFPDSDEEEEDEETALLRQEVTPPRLAYSVVPSNALSDIFKPSLSLTQKHPCLNMKYEFALKWEANSVVGDDICPSLSKKCIRCLCCNT